MGRTKNMRSCFRTAGCGTAAAVQTLEFVGVKETNLFFADRVYHRPVIPHGAAQTDQNRASGSFMEKRHHFTPELIQGCFRTMFKRHAPVMDLVIDNIPQNSSDGYQVDTFD